MASTPEPLPSLPPSPGRDPVPESAHLGSVEDVARVWHDEPDPQTRLNSRKGKGKGRARQGGESDEDQDEDDGARFGYPPTKEEEAESRRVQENLRRWEIAERQRRKAARESASAPPVNPAGGVSSANNSPSLFADLFRRDSRKAPLGGIGTHHVLSTTDEGVPLNDLETLTLDRSSPIPEPENPFDTPNASRTSLNIPAHSAIMTESDTVPDEISGSRSANSLQVPNRPTLQASSSFAVPTPKKKQHPPPQPLDLPPPRAPPPLVDAPSVEDKPPEPVPAPSTEARSTELERGRGEEEERQQGPVKWWHEWLCGCGEGPDRGGDHQAGRTNPFE